jgi:cytochrome c peroxidase
LNIRTHHIIIINVVLIFCLSSCKDDNDLTEIEYNPISYNLEVPEIFPIFVVPEDNSLTEAGVQLGRRLFYDPILSADNTMSCSSCHLREHGFADITAGSTGIDGITGDRNSMSLLNLAFIDNGFFWDGRADNLEEQALEPITNPIELHDDWVNVEDRIREHDDYPERFRKAFGITNKTEITSDLVTKALAQFERIMVSGGDSKYDKILTGEIFPSDSEFNGYDMFFDVSPDLPDAECGHCHGGPLLTTSEYFNNGLDPASDLNDFPDKGRGDITGVLFDNGKFRAPSLRNIALTAPYMHDGRFETLQEVVEHYNSGGHYADNLDPLIGNLGLNEEQIQDIVNLLHTFTDTTYLQNEDLTNPFE